MDFFLMTEPQLGGTYQDLARAARGAEAAGLAGFARSDHYYWTGPEPLAATDAFTSVGGLALETTHAQLAVLVSPITFRHPAVIQKSAATLDEMSGGRFSLGLGTGWMEKEHEVFGLPFPPRKERFARLEESLQYMRASIEGKSFEGRYYRFSAQALPHPQSLRLIVGGSGPEKTPALAGRYADEYNQFALSPAELAPKVERMRTAAEAAGRDPDQLVVSLMGPAVLAQTEQAFASLMKTAADVRKISVNELTQRWQRNGIPMGTPDRIRDAFAALEEVGVSRYYVQWLDLTDHGGLDESLAAVQLLSA